MNNALLKHTIVLLLLSSLIPFACAQNRIDLPYYFCAMNGTCFNQPPSWYVRVEDEDFSYAEATYNTEMFQMTHPEYTILELASKLYNCHGYAYSVYQGGERLIIEWKDYLCSYNSSTIESYIQIPENSIRFGDIATIIDPNDNGLYSIHSSIVLNADTVISKWGNNPLFKHYKYDPWIVSNTQLGTATQYVYYRRVINDSISGSSVFNGTGSYVFIPDVTPSSCTWSVEPAAMFQNSSGTGYTANLSYATPLTYLASKATIQCILVLSI